MSTVSLGTSQAVETELSWAWDTNRGPVTYKTFKGPEAAINAVAAQYTAQGWSARCTRGPGGRWTLELVSSQDGTGAAVFAGIDVRETWEISANKVQKDLLEADCAAVRALNDVKIAQLRKYDANPLDGMSPPFTDSNQISLWQLMQAGVKSFQIFQPVLRHTYSVPTNYYVSAASFNYTGRIISTSKIYTQEGAPNTMLVGLNTIVGSFSNPSRTDSVELAYGWYKNFPSLSVSNQGRLELALEYEFGLWSTLLYGAVV